jgi:DNA-binding transcriptional MerR regulator
MLKIGDFSSLSQISIKTLRYHDEREGRWQASTAFQHRWHS